MVLVQVLLLGAVLAVLAALALRVHTVRIRALKRVAFVLFLGLTVDAILRPQDTTWVAHRVGVGRGADLLLYCLAMVFFAFVVNTYLRFRNLERRFADLVRATALRDAYNPNHHTDQHDGDTPGGTGTSVPNPNRTGADGVDKVAALSTGPGEPA